MNKILSEQQILQAIHECVYGSTIRHVVGFHPALILKYLSTFPFYRGADVLYYFLLEKYGSNVHYAEDGRHMLVVKPELIGVYVTAGQDTHALSQRDVTGNTIYQAIKDNITRTISCGRYQGRYSIMTGEADFTKAIQIPSIALSTSHYNTILADLGKRHEIVNILVDFDYWEAFSILTLDIFTVMICRISFAKGAYPNLWEAVLRNYYTEQLQRLNIHSLFPSMNTKQLTIMSMALPDLIQLPPGLDTLGIRLWFSHRSARAYLLGFDICDGIPSDEIVSERLRHLQRVGIEQYCSEITKIHIDEKGLLTGRIGIMNYPRLAGKKLINTTSTQGVSIEIYYPYDLHQIVCGENVYLLPHRDIGNVILSHIDDYEEDYTIEMLTEILVNENFPYLTETPSENDIDVIFQRLIFRAKFVVGYPVRERLVEVMSNDIVDYMLQ